MDDATLSPDGAWRWDGQQWIPNQAPPPPPPSSPVSRPASATASPLEAPPFFQSSERPHQGRDWIVWVALGAGVIALMMIGLQVLGQTRHAFGDHSSYWAPWYFKFWFLVVEFCFGVVAIALGLFAALRKPGPLATIVVALAAAVFFQGALDMYYRVVVNHFGYGLSLSF